MDTEITSSDPGSELISFEIIRSETALSRYPIHNLSTKDGVLIEIVRRDDNGVVTLNWEVSHNSRYGQPGRLAYKLDTIIINRRIEEANKPVPKLIRLGSLREIASQVEAGEKNTGSVKRALLQNASATITAKMTYKAVDRTERTLEAVFSRYSVLFTGQTLPDGRNADGVYLILNDIYMEVLNNAVTRPLDYDYLRGLSPSEQRFYEIISYQIFPAIKYNQRARLLYSEYCVLSTQVQYFDFEHVKKQMYKVHRPHMRSGYIAGVEYEATQDRDGKPDWIMRYVPGPKAKQEHQTFSQSAGSRRKKRICETKAEEPESNQFSIGETAPADTTPTLPFLDVSYTDTEADALVRHFYEAFHKSGETARPNGREIAQAKALLTRLGPVQARQLVSFARQEAQKTNFAIQTFGGILQYEGPATTRFLSEEKKRTRAQHQRARQEHQEAHRGAYYQFLSTLLHTEMKISLPEAYDAFITYETKLRRFWKDRSEKSAASAEVFEKFDLPATRGERLETFLRESKTAGVPDFWEWDSRHNPNSRNETA